ncbi:MAG: hypothetical protein WAU30_00565, partial [Propionicimonas sp.]
RLYHSESLAATGLGVLQAKLGERIEYLHHKVPLPAGVADLKLAYRSGVAEVSFRQGAEGAWRSLIADVDVTYLSDEGVNGEPGEIGGFTGLFTFIAAVDVHQHDSFADFSHYSVTNREPR